MTDDETTPQEARTPIWRKKLNELTDEERDCLDREQCPANRAALREIVSEHQRWLRTNGREGARLSLHHQDLAGIDITNAKFDGAWAENASFRGARLWLADFSEGNLTDASFKGANMAGADFTDTRSGGHTALLTKERVAQVMRSNPGPE